MDLWALRRLRGSLELVRHHASALDKPLGARTKPKRFKCDASLAEWLGILGGLLLGWGAPWGVFVPEEWPGASNALRVPQAVTRLTVYRLLQVQYRKPMCPCF